MRDFLDRSELQGLTPFPRGAVAYLLLTDCIRLTINGETDEREREAAGRMMRSPKAVYRMISIYAVCQVLWALPKGIAVGARSSSQNAFGSFVVTRLTQKMDGRAGLAANGSVCKRAICNLCKLISGALCGNSFCILCSPPQLANFFGKCNVGLAERESRSCHFQQFRLNLGDCLLCLLVVAALERTFCDAKQCRGAGYGGGYVHHESPLLIGNLSKGV